ncbi:MAG: pyruvate kinase [Armatimonadetes bacterium]|nr:pyruvate kinase [Armatimonadota bacterium]
MPNPRRTKIVCTLGPATRHPKEITALVDAGMNVVRLNASHGDLNEHAQTIRHVRQVAHGKNLPIAILLDLPGPKIRIGEVPEGMYLERGRNLTLTSRPGDIIPAAVYLPNPEVAESVSAGTDLFLDDGLIHLKVISSVDGVIETEVLVGGPLSSHKGLAVPGVSLPIDIVTPRDAEVIHFGVEQGVDWIAASFVRSADDVAAVRRHIESAGGSIPVIAKIEKHEAVDAIDEIIEVSDGIMVARGDLGVETSIWDVPVIQKEIIRKCNCAGKPVITATQMLESMISQRRPTRAEATDVVNAILDGSDCVMLSAETAVGRYPSETVQMMDHLAQTAEAAMDYATTLTARRKDKPGNVTDAISGATCEIAHDLGAAAILTATTSGSTARMVARYRPKSPILGITANPETYRRLALSWGVTPLMAPQSETVDDTLRNSFRAARHSGLVKPGDTVVLTAGFPAGQSGNTNLIRVATFKEG